MAGPYCGLFGIEFVCGVCGERVEARRDFIDADIPATCPHCLSSTWIVGTSGRFETVPASRAAQEHLSLLCAEKARVHLEVKRANERAQKDQYKVDGARPGDDREKS